MIYGTKTDWNPPSEKTRLKKTGNLNAMRYASISAFAPRKCDNRASLAVPKRRLIAVRPLTVKNFRKILIVNSMLTGFSFVCIIQHTSNFKPFHILICAFCKVLLYIIINNTKNCFLVFEKCQI